MTMTDGADGDGLPIVGFVDLRAALNAHKALCHGTGHSPDWVHGYWKALDDVALSYGLVLDLQTDFSRETK